MGQNDHPHPISKVRAHFSEAIPKVGRIEEHHRWLMSARDIVELLAIYLPRRPRNETVVLRQMRHGKAIAIIGDAG